MICFFRGTTVPRKCSLRRVEHDVPPGDYFFKALSWNRVDGVARGTSFYFGTGDNIHCHKAARFHTGERQHVSTAGSLDPLCGEAAQRIRSARYCFRSSPPPCRIAMRREVSFHSLPRSRLRRSMICSALFHDRAFLIIMKYSCSSHKSICSFPYEIPQDCTCVHA